MKTAAWVADKTMRAVSVSSKAEELYHDLSETE